jgi:hypothetical protein
VVSGALKLRKFMRLASSPFRAAKSFPSSSPVSRFVRTEQLDLHPGVGKFSVLACDGVHVQNNLPTRPGRQRPAMENCSRSSRFFVSVSWVHFRAERIGVTLKC